MLTKNDWKKLEEKFATKEDLKRVQERNTGGNNFF